MTISSKLIQGAQHRWRHIGIIASGLLFVLSVLELIFGAVSDVGTWRCIAMTSLYLSFSLTQRRLFAPASKRYQNAQRSPYLR